MTKSGYLYHKISNHFIQSYYNIDHINHTLNQYLIKPITIEDYLNPVSKLSLIHCDVTIYYEEEVISNISNNSNNNTSNANSLATTPKSSRSLSNFSSPKFNNIIKDSIKIPSINEPLPEIKYYFQIRSNNSDDILSCNNIPNSTDSSWTLYITSLNELEEWIQIIDLTSSLGLMVEEIELSLKYAILSPTNTYNPILFSALGNNIMQPINIENNSNKEVVDLDVKKRASALVKATDNMLQSIELIEGINRDKLEFIAKRKWDAKVKVMDFEKLSKSQLIENESQLINLKVADLKLRNQLSEMNEDVATVEKMIRASCRLQNEATVAFNLSKGNFLSAANMLRKRYCDSRSPSAQIYIQLLNKHFPPTAPANLDSTQGGVFYEKFYNMFDVLTFYSDYYDNTHLPRDLELQTKRQNKLNVWKNLVQCVTDTQTVTRAIEELKIILDEIDKCLHPNPHSFQTLAINSTHTNQPSSAGGSLYTAYRSNSITEYESKFGDHDIETPLEPTLEFILKSWTPNSDPTQLSLLTVYKKYWIQLSAILAELHYFRTLEASVRKELDSALQNRESLHLFRTAC